MANSIKMEIELDGKDALKTIQALGANLKKTGESATNATKKASVFGDVLKAQLTSIIAVNFGAVLKAQFLEAVQGFRDFETGIIDTAKTANLTAKEMEDLGDEIVKLTRTIPATTKELLEISTAAGQLGITGVKNLSKFSEVIAKLGRVSNLEGGEAATVLTRILTVTKEGSEGIETFANVIVSLGNSFAATESEIAFMTNEVVRATSQFGVSSAEAAALGATLRSFGVRAEEAGGVLTRSFIAINASIKEGGSKLERLKEITGLSGEEIKKQFGENASKFFRNFVAGLGKAEGGVKNISKNLESLGISGLRVSKVFAPLVNNVDEYDRALGLANEQVKNGTALNDEFNRSLVSSDSKIKLFQNAWSNLTRQIAGSAAPTFNNITSVFTAFLEKLAATSPIETATANLKGLAATSKDVSDTTATVNNLLGGSDGWFPNIVKLNKALAEGRVSRINEELVETRRVLEDLQGIDPAKGIKEVQAELDNLSKANDDPLLDSMFSTGEAFEARKATLEGQLENLIMIRDLHSGKLLEIAEKEKKLLADAEQAKFDLLNELKISQDELDLENKELEIETKIADDQLGLQQLQEILGEEEALREIARIRTLDSEAKQELALAALKKKARDKATKDREAAEKKRIQFELISAQTQISLVSNTGNLINTISGKQTKAGFLLSKAAAVASVLVADGTARAQATTAATGAAAASGTAAPVVFALTQAQLQGVITANTAISLGTIAASTIGGFAEGGLITGGSQVNDRLLANVNAGETILNRRQSNTVFREIDNGNLGGGGGSSFTFNNPILMNESGIDDVIDMINDAQEFRNKELRIS